MLTLNTYYHVCFNIPLSYSTYQFIKLSIICENIANPEELSKNDSREISQFYD